MYIASTSPGCKYISHRLQNYNYIKTHELLHVNFFLNFFFKKMYASEPCFVINTAENCSPLVTAQQKGSDLSEIAFGCLEG